MTTIEGEMGPTAVDLFSGIGGMSLGLKHAGFSVRAAVEIDALAAKTYRLNHPEVALIEGDLRLTRPDELANIAHLKPGELTLLAGCPPCEGFSRIRTLNGSEEIDDPRNDLVLEFARFAESLKPKSILIENVPALASDERMTVLASLLGEMGYSSAGASHILNAADYGVPQRRRRFVFMAGLGFPIAIGAPRLHQETVRSAIGALPQAGRSGDPLHDLPEKRSAAVTDLIRSIPKNGGSRLDLPASRQLPCHTRTNGFKDVYGRMKWDSVAPTITGGCVNPSKGRFLHPDENRAITLREAALLQGLPLGYQVSLDKGKMAAAALIGDALPPPFIAAQGKGLLRSIRETKGSDGGKA